MNLPTVEPSEQTFSPQTVCVWVTGVYLARAFDLSVPNTKTEAIALAADSGVIDWYNAGRANYTKLAAGMKKRYGLVGKVYEGAASAKAAVLAAAQASAHAIGIAGDQLNLNPHWQSGSVGHSIAVLYENGTTGIQLDPLAPAGYAGDSFSITELNQYATAAIIFKEENPMPGYKIGTNIGTFRMVGVHALISPQDPKVRYMQPADAGPWDVAASLDLKNPDRTPIDIDGNSPPLNDRDKVYLVDAPGFDNAALVLRQDGVFTSKVVPQAKYDADVAAAFAQGRGVGADAVAAAAETEAKKY